MKYMIIAMVFLSSCLTENKVNRWLDDHEQQAAGYCAKRFPPDTLTKTVIEQTDSAGYYDAYMSMAYLADSLFYRLDSLQHLQPGERPKINIDSLKKVIDKEIRKRLKPCVDTVRVVTNTVIDRARERQLQGVIDEKDNMVSARDKRNSELEAKVKAKNKYVWLFWIAIVLIVGYTALRLRGKLPI